jgi:hypothetical protein
MKCKLCDNVSMTLDVLCIDCKANEILRGMF